MTKTAPDATDGRATESNAEQGPLEWHPLIRALLYLRDWTAVAVCAAVVWEFLRTGEFHLLSTPGPTLARAAWLLVALALGWGALLVVELWWMIVRHARREYNHPFVIRLILVISAVLAVCLASYLWAASWLMDHAWQLLSRWSDVPVPPAAAQSPGMLPTWLVAVLLIALGGAMLRYLALIYPVTAAKYAMSVRAMGVRRVLQGMLMMAFLRLRQPRRDFFFQAPVVSWMPWLAAAAALKATIPIAALAWAIPGLLLAIAAVLALDIMIPPMWLYLGVSQFDAFGVFHQLRESWRGHTGVTLLDRDGPHGARYYTADAQLRISRGSFASRLFFDPGAPRVWSLRTRPGLWVPTVRQLVGFVPVVVVDVRSGSGHVRDEIDWLAESRNLGKAWFLVADDERGGTVTGTQPGSPDVLAAVRIPAGAQVASEAMLLGATWTDTALQVAAGSRP